MREQLRFLHLNTVQLSKLLQENVPSYNKGKPVSSCQYVRPAVCIHGAGCCPAALVMGTAVVLVRCFLLVSSSHQVAKVLELQLQHHSFQ